MNKDLHFKISKNIRIPNTKRYILKDTVVKLLKLDNMKPQAYVFVRVVRVNTVSKIIKESAVRDDTYALYLEDVVEDMIVN